MGTSSRQTTLRRPRCPDNPEALCETFRSAQASRPTRTALTPALVCGYIIPVSETS